MESNEEKILVLASLLHDVGKLNYSSERPHHISAEDFIECLNLPKDIKNSLSDIIRQHHDEPSPTELAKILIDADRLSAKSEREKRHEEKGRRESEPLKSVFSFISLEKGIDTDQYYPLQILFYRDILVYPMKKDDAIRNSRKLVIGEGISRTLSESYNRLSHLLEMEFTKLKCDDANNLIDTLNYILRKYLQFVPSATYRDIPDISLYDHLKTTAAIAHCLYKGEKSKEFLLIMGDISGIQNFIFSDFRGAKKHAKRLRGRSLYIHLLANSVTRYIKDELDLYEFNILWESGGNFVILAPNTEENREKLKNIEKHVNKFLLDKFGISLYVALSWIEGCKDDIENFPDFLRKLYEKNDEKKNKKYRNFNFQSMVKEIEKSTNENDVCMICGLREGEGREDSVVCNDCYELISLGEKLVHGTGYILITKNEIKDKFSISFNFGDKRYCYHLLEENEVRNAKEINESEPVFLYSINSYDISNDISAINCGYGFKLIGNYVPTRGKKIISFDELVDYSNLNAEKRKSEKDGGKPSKLGILKADVDNLGLLFSYGFERKLRTISRITMLSFLFDLFFSIYVNRIAKGKNIYVVFSGGDDLTVIGRWDEILDFAIALNDEFRKWVCNNPNITISAGVELADVKFPVRRLVNLGELALEKSKENKNRVTLFNSDFMWDCYKNVRNISDTLYEYVKDGKISMSLIYYFHTLWRKSKYNPENNPPKPGLEIIVTPDPYIKYAIVRNVKNKSKREEISKLVQENFEHMNVITSIVSLKKRF